MLDHERHLRYSLLTLRKIREEFGKEALESGLTDDKLAKVLWYGLVGEDPALTVEKIEEIVDLENLSPVLEAMTKAMGYRTRTVPQGPPAPPPAAASGENTDGGG